MMGARIEVSESGGYSVWNNDVVLATCPTEELATLVLEGVSHRLDSRAAWTFADALSATRGALARVETGPNGGRALALVHTKLDEAELWFTRVAR